jgi:hexosaminidase
MPKSLLLACLLPVWLLAAAPGSHKPLLPRPQEVRYGGTELPVRGLSVRFASAPGAEDRFAARELSAALSSIAEMQVPVLDVERSGKTVLLSRTGDVAALPAADERPGPDSRESYSIKIDSNGAEIRARSSAGLFYGVQTLRQLVEGEGAHAVLPEVEIRDWPSLAYRGFMMDMSHGPLPREEEIKRQIDFLARWKVNQYYFYSEVSIELTGYPLFSPKARYTREQVRRIIDYARERHVDVVPCLEYYGHLHDVFQIERYADLAALPHGGEFNPRHPRVRELLADWVAQMAGLFPSPWFHIGLDEPFELEAAGSQAAGGVEPAKLYIELLQFVSSLVRKHDKRVMFWADVATGSEIFVRYPQLVSELPPGTIAVAWDYEARKDYTSFVKPFSEGRIPHVIATGLWTWNEVVPDFNRTFANVDGFLAAARRQGSLGIIHTGWHDAAQTLYRQTLPGMAYGAAAAWQSEPVDHSRFFSDYAAGLYPEAIASDVASALEAINKSRQHLEDALGRDTMHRLWEDPLAPDRLKRAASHRAEFREARLQAESAQELLMRALEIKPDAPALSSLLLGARMLDYLGQKYLYALEIEGYFTRLGKNPKSSDLYLFLGFEASYQDHSRAIDLMDAISEMREDYRAAWLEEYHPFRLRRALGRWDAEYEYWRRLQERLSEFASGFKDNDTLPPLESFRPR